MPSHGDKVIVIEDEAPIRRFLKTTLTAHGYEFKEAITGAEGILKVAEENPSVVILDLGLPDMDGLSVLKQIREWSNVPIIILSAREQEGDKVKALDDGADDYLTKPFGVAELLARIRAAIRRASSIIDQDDISTVQFGSIKVDQAKRLVYLEDNEVHLTPIEYKLLVVLIRHRGKVLTHNQLLKEVWGQGYMESPQYLRVYMAQLRKKLEKEPTNPEFFLTEPGIGYRLKEEPYL
ncbi:MAG TPA: response regulator [Candidatus Melainabacteria bacterium]|nr:response regulator [Candidatus Melainabacteria bacterium]